MAELDAGAQHLTGDIGIDGIVGHPAPGGVARRSGRASAPLRWRATIERVPSAPMTATASRMVESDSASRTPSAVVTSSWADSPVCTVPSASASASTLVSAERRITTSGSPRALTNRSGAGWRSHVPSRQRRAPAVTLPPASRTASPTPISSSAASALGQMLMPAPDEVSVRSSMTVTSWPRRCNATAVASPEMPAPMTRICFPTQRM